MHGRFLTISFLALTLGACSTFSGGKDPQIVVDTTGY